MLPFFMALPFWLVGGENHFACLTLACCLGAVLLVLVSLIASTTIIKVMAAGMLRFGPRGLRTSIKAFKATPFSLKAAHVSSFSLQRPLLQHDGCSRLLRRGRMNESPDEMPPV